MVSQGSPYSGYVVRGSFLQTIQLFKVVRQVAKREEKKFKPISRKASSIVGRIAECRTVEDLVRNVTHHSKIDADLADLVQIIYFALLQTDVKRLEYLVTSGGIRFYIVRMIQNQYFSKNSPFYMEIRKFSDRTSEISSQISKTYDAEKDYSNR